jgi:glycosyltransferase involved in cell wall biosynthesis
MYEPFTLSIAEHSRRSKQARDAVFVVRGDIISTTGYAKAARALAEIIGERHAIWGMSIHESPGDNKERFPGPLIGETDVKEIAKTKPVYVIHHTTPQDFKVVPNAINIGAFYWETNGIPRKFHWIEKIACMDAIWAPTSFVRDFVLNCGFTGPIPIVPWPHHFTPRPRPNVAMSRSEILSFDKMPALGAAESSMARGTLKDLRGGVDVLFLAIQSLAPRKGLGPLLREWRAFLKRNPDVNTVLLLKLSFRHAHGINRNPISHFHMLLRRYGFQPDDRLNIALLNETLTESELDIVLGSADCLVSATFGEGFGGPIVEALAREIPVIAPRHTGIADLLPPDYELRIPTKEVFVSLRDNLEIYPPASSWNVPIEGALSDLFSRFITLDAQTRRHYARRAARHAEDFCGVAATRDKLFNDGMVIVQ